MNSAPRSNEHVNRTGTAVPLSRRYEAEHVLGNWR